MNWRKALCVMAGPLLVLGLSVVGIANGSTADPGTSGDTGGDQEMNLIASDKPSKNLLAAVGNPGVYTYNADFDEGTLVNVNHDTPNDDQLQLDSEAMPFDFIWVAASARGTIVKIDTETGDVLGEYRAAPTGRGLNPSRTTVDGNGNVWSGNRDESAGDSGSVVKIGLKENGQCVDRNTNGVIDTSTGLGDILDWPDVTDGAGGADGIVEDADDECILIYQRLPGAPNARHVSIGADNDVWVAGYPFVPTTFHKVDGDDGSLLTSFSAGMLGCGGYGGLIDGNGVLWSASISQSLLLRYDIGASSGSCIPVTNSYGLGIDSSGYIWNGMWTANTVVKINPGGGIVAGFPVPTGGNSSRGVVATPADDDVWIANSGSNTVTRLDNNGVLKATIAVGSTPTGVAVDAAGKVWVTNVASHDVMRIDPATDSVDLTVPLGAGAGPYNYSDMTGSTLIAPPDEGTWTIIHDSGITDAVWGLVTWTSSEPGDSTLVVTAASSTDGSIFGPAEVVTAGDDLSVDDGRYLRVSVSFERAFTGESPVLFDLTILANRPPDCSNAHPSIDTLWPPNHKFRGIEILGVTDPDGDEVTISVEAIFQDEPVDTAGDGNFVPDGMGIGDPVALLRAERAGPPWLPADGRVYKIVFSATDIYDDHCQGTVFVGVPHDKGGLAAINSAPPYYDSTAE